MRRFIAFVLAFSLIFCGINFTAIGAEGCIPAFAFAVGEVATDTYVSYNKLRQDLATTRADLRRVLGLVVKRTSSTSQDRASTESIYNDNDAESEDQDYTSDMSSLWRLATSKYKNGVYNGYFTYEQKNIDAAAQVKTGKWLTDTEFESMAGTPTTIDQFVTMGGTQWIVDMQYRVTNADYVRKYHFVVDDIKNYMYHKAGSVSDNGSTTFEWDSVKTTKNDGYHEQPDGQPQAEPGYIAGRVYDSVYNAPSLDKTGKYSALLANTDVPQAHTYNNWAYRYYEGFTSWDCPQECEEHTKKGQTASGKEFRYPKKDDFSKAGMSRTDFENMTPNMVEAVSIRKAVLNFLKNWESVFNSSKDNYRADQGKWDAEYESGGDASADFMYTYGGLIRKSDTASNSGSYKMSKPAIVTHFYDWAGATGSSKTVKYKTGGIGSRDEICKALLEGADGRSAEQQQLFPVDIEQSVLGRGSFDVTTDSIVRGKKNMYEVVKDFNDIAQLQLLATGQKLEPEDLYWLSNIANAYQFGGNVTPGMGLTANMGGSISGFPSIKIGSVTYDFNSGGFSEIGFWYYYVLYYMYCNFGWCLFSDEVNQYFGQMPGATTISDSQTENMLAFVFGQNIVQEYNKVVKTFKDFDIDVPFAVMSRGVNLDSDWDAGDGDKRNQASNAATWDLTELFFPGLKWKEDGFTTYLNFTLSSSKLIDFNYYMGIFDHDTHAGKAGDNQTPYCRKSKQMEEWDEYNTGTKPYTPNVWEIAGEYRICNSEFDGHNDDCVVPGDNDEKDTGIFTDPNTGYHSDSAGDPVDWDGCEDTCVHYSGKGTYGTQVQIGHIAYLGAGHTLDVHLHRAECHYHPDPSSTGGMLLEGQVLYNIDPNNAEANAKYADEKYHVIKKDNWENEYSNNYLPKNSPELWPSLNGTINYVDAEYSDRPSSTHSESFEGRRGPGTLVSGHLAAMGSTYNGVIGSTSTVFNKWEFDSSDEAIDHIMVDWPPERVEKNALEGGGYAPLQRFMADEVDKEKRHRVDWAEQGYDFVGQYNSEFYKDINVKSYEWRDGFCVDRDHVSNNNVKIHWENEPDQLMVDENLSNDYKHCPGNTPKSQHTAYLWTLDQVPSHLHTYQWIDADGKLQTGSEQHYSSYVWKERVVEFGHYHDIHTHIIIGAMCEETTLHEILTEDTGRDNAETDKNSPYYIRQDDCGGKTRHYWHHGHARTLQAGNKITGLVSHSGPKKNGVGDGVLLRDHDEHWVEDASYKYREFDAPNDSDIKHLQYAPGHGFVSVDWAYSEGEKNSEAEAAYVDSPGPDTHCARLYEEKTGSVKVTSNVKLVEGNWSKQPDLPGTEQVTGQRFHNVEWLDIDSYNIWAMNRGFSKGLSLLLAEPVTFSSEYNDMETLMVSNALSQNGYTLFNIEDYDSTYPTNGVAYDKTDRNNLQYAGRIGNSLNFTSKGNGQSDGFRFYMPHSGGTSRCAVSSFAVNDVPALGMPQDNDARSRQNMDKYLYINGDPQAFYLDKDKSSSPTSDDLWFRYNPYSQGGRSDKDHLAFISQALALSLYWCADNAEFNTPDKCPTWDDSTYKIPYANSILIQGDYLIMDYNDETYANESPDGQTMIGFIYDVWQERSENAKGHYGDQFGLVSDGKDNDALARYNRYCKWIPGRLSYMLGRSNKQHIWNSGGKLGTDENTWLVLTYGQGINSDTHGCWDSIYNDEQGKCGEGKHVDPGNIQSQNKLVSLSSVLRDNNDGTYNIIDLYYTPHRKEVKYPHKLLQDAMMGVGGTFDTDWMYATTDEQIGWVGYGAASDGGHTGDKDIVRTVHNSATEQDGWLQTSTQAWTYFESFLRGGKDMDGNGKVSTYKDFGVQNTYGNPSDAGQGVHIYKDKHYNTGNLNRGSCAESADNFSKFYPWLQHLNLDRYMQNDRWQTGYAFNEYVSVGKHVDKNAGHATADVHTQRFKTDVPKWEAFLKNDIDLSASDDRVYVNAAYLRGQGSGNFDGRPNDIVVYNPVGTQSAHIIPASKYLPDAGNTGMSDASNTDTYKYTQTYLHSFLEYVRRDWRVTTKYEIDVNKMNSEKYMSMTGFEFEKLVQSSDRYTHQYDIIDRKLEIEEGTLTKQQALDTDYVITMSDYEITTEQLPPFTFTDMSQTTKHQIDKSGTYEMTVYESNAKNMSVSMDLVQGDEIIVNNPTKTVSVNYAGAADGKITYEQFKTAYKEMCDRIYTETGTREFEYDEEVVNEHIPLKTGMNMSIGVAGTNYTTRRGQSFSIKMRFEGTTANPIEIEQSGYHIWYDTIPDVANNAVDVIYYFDVIALSAPLYFPIKVRRNVNLQAFAGNAFQNIPTVICHVGSGDGNFTGDVYTTEYEYRISPTGVREIERTTWNNKFVCDIRGSWQISGVNIITQQGFYLNIKSASTATIKLKDDVINNPHHVPNADWRYYVLGYTNTTTSTVITSIDQVHAGDTILFPSGLEISANEIEDIALQGKLGVYIDSSGNYGLIDLNEDKSYEHESRYTGYIVTPHFKVVSFGGTTNYLDKALTYDQTADPNFDIAQYRVEMVFVAKASNFSTNTTIKTALYSVAFSTSYEHRIASSEDTYTQINETVSLGMDWKLTIRAIIEFDEEVYNRVFADALSLDDEFMIYWDNYADLTVYDGADAYGNKLRNLYDTSPVLGDGWDNSGEAHVNKGYGKVNTSRYCAFNKLRNMDYWRYLTSYTDLTDTTKWIYEKYVIFNTDMYAFTRGNSYTYDDTRGPLNQIDDWDPTTPAYNSSGDPNNIVYIPAGSKVYLGYYLQRSWPTGHSNNDSVYGVSDNNGRFIDFGYNYTSEESDTKSERKKTRDPNGNLYTYHFWNPLSNGEMDGTGTVQFVVNGINSVNDAWDVHYTGSKHPQRVNAGNVPDHWRGTSPTMKGSLTELHRYHQPAPVSAGTPEAHGKMDEWNNAVLRAIGFDMSSNAKGILSGEPAGESALWTESDVYDRYTSSASSQRYTLIGRIGGLTLYDTGDPRYQDTFKQINPDPNKREYAIAPFVWSIKKYSNIDGEEGAQFKYLVDMLDVRGRFLVKTPTDENTDVTYKLAVSGDTYAHTAWYLSKAYITGRRELLPLTSEFNIHEEVRNEVQTIKLGYEVHCSLSTIGNYFGSLGRRPADNASTYVNTNNDYGQTKVQVQPKYVLFNEETEEFIPVDAYMRQGVTYKLINAGSEMPYHDEGDPEEDFPYYLDTFRTNKNPVTILPNQDGTNLSEHRYNLDQNMLRESVTKEENEKTYYVIHDEKNEDKYEDKYGNNLAIRNGFNTSLLDPYEYGNNDVGGTALDESYTYGNAQMEFLREFNRTFIGGSTLALNESDSHSGFSAMVQRNATKFAQKWRFTVGLPSSTVFVKHGDPINPTTIINVEAKYWLICLIDIYSIGEKWVLHYESNISGEDIKIRDTYYPWERWNVYKESFPYLIPIFMSYLPAGTSADDKDIRGTH